MTSAGPPESNKIDKKAETNNQFLLMCAASKLSYAMPTHYFLPVIISAQYPQKGTAITKAPDVDLLKTQRYQAPLFHPLWVRRALSSILYAILRSLINYFKVIQILAV